VCDRADKPCIACYVAPFIVGYENVDLGGMGSIWLTNRECMLVLTCWLCEFVTCPLERTFTISREV
jgi:hypothetical protein